MRMLAIAGGRSPAQPHPSMTITVLVPTYRRPADLIRCLDGLRAQTVPADEILVTVRDNDVATQSALESYGSSAMRVVVRTPGLVAALNAALDVAKGEILAVTDDDCVPRPEWLGQLVRRFDSDRRIGGVGGPDWIHVGGCTYDGSAGVCGTVQWFGRIDSAHLRRGVCDVDILKGCNMAFRRAAVKGLRFDTRLAGSGAQMFNEFGFSLAVRRANWRLVYDPDVTVDHFPGARFDEDQRGTFVYEAHANAVHNRTLLLLTHLRASNRAAYLAYAVLVGSRPWPGLAWLPIRVWRRTPHAVAYWRATAAGHTRGLRTFLDAQRSTGSRSARGKPQIQDG